MRRLTGSRGILGILLTGLVAMNGIATDTALAVPSAPILPIGTMASARILSSPF